MHRKVAAALAVATALAAPAFAQAPSGPPKLTVHAVRGGAYWVEGGRSNEGFIVGKTGVIAIDTETDIPTTKLELAEIAKITPKPVNTLIVTHGDPDHVGGVAAFPNGIRFIAHENIRAQIQAAAIDPNGGPYGPPYKDLAAHHLPTETLSDGENVTIDGVRMRILHIAPAHSSGDLFIYLPDLKVVYGGDIVLTNLGPYPVIHIGGSSAGWIESMKAMLALDADIYVPGHGPIESKAQLAARIKVVEQRRAQIKAMVDQGKTLAEVEAALPDKAENPMFKTFTQTTYEELSLGYPPALAPWANVVHR